MEDPLRDLPSIAHALTTSTPQHQKRTIETYFLANASFDHPLVLLPSFFFPIPSRTALLGIYRFYKFLSPNISLQITSIALDTNPGKPRAQAGIVEKEAVAYVRADQTFRFWFWPFWDVEVELVAQLTLVEREQGHELLGTRCVGLGEGHTVVQHEGHESNSSGPESVVDMNEEGIGGARRLWYIKQQKDLYQSDQFLAYLPFFLPGVPTMIRIARRLGTLGTVIMVTFLTLVMRIFQSFFDLAISIFANQRPNPRQAGHVVVKQKSSSKRRRLNRGNSNTPLKWLDLNGPKELIVGTMGGKPDGKVSIL